MQVKSIFGHLLYVIINFQIAGIAITTLVNERRRFVKWFIVTATLLDDSWPEAFDGHIYTADKAEVEALVSTDYCCYYIDAKAE